MDRWCDCLCETCEDRECASANCGICGGYGRMKQDECEYYMEDGRRINDSTFLTEEEELRRAGLLFWI